MTSPKPPLSRAFLGYFWVPTVVCHGRISGDCRPPPWSDYPPTLPCDPLKRYFPDVFQGIHHLICKVFFFPPFRLDYPPPRVHSGIVLWFLYFFPPFIPPQRFVPCPPLTPLSSTATQLSSGGSCSPEATFETSSASLEFVVSLSASSFVLFTGRGPGLTSLRPFSDYLFQAVLFFQKQVLLLSIVEPLFLCTSVFSRTLHHQFPPDADVL